MTYKKRPNFLESELASEVKEQLVIMSKDKRYNTDDSYSANADKYPDHSRTFVEKHMDYLASHPTVDPIHYMANLKLVSKIR